MLVLADPRNPGAAASPYIAMGDRCVIDTRFGLVRFFTFNGSTWDTAQTSTTIAASDGPAVIIGRHSGNQNTITYRVLSGANSGLSLSGVIGCGARNHSLQPLTVGGDVEVPSRATDGLVYLGAYWNRALSESEIASLQVNPWQLFDVQRRSMSWAAGGGVTITVQDATHAHAAGNITLTGTSGVDLAVSASFHIHAADALTLTAEWLLAVAAAVHAQVADNLTLTVGGSPTLAADSTQHAHSADNLGLSLAIWLALQDASHAHAASNVALVVASPDADLALAIKIIKNRKQLNPTTGLYTVFDDDGVTPLLQAAAWVDPAGTIPYAGGLVQRVDRLEPI